MEFSQEKKKHLAYLGKIRPRALEVQNVLSYSVQQFSEEQRLEYMSFIQDNNLQHSWAGMLAWWRYRKHTDMDKTIIQAIKRTMEVKKRQDYTLFSTCRKHKSRHSQTLAVDPSPTKLPNTRNEDDDDDEGTPPPPPPPPPPSPPTKKKDDTIILQKLIMRMSPRDWYEFMLMHDQHTQSLLPDLRKFLHTKYIHEENTSKRDKYGQLCNIVEYPLTFRPYEEDFAAKRKLTFDPTQSIDQANYNKPKTFINREFAGSTFPVYMSSEEYTDRCLTSHHVLLPNIDDNGALEIDTIPQDPPPYGLYRINEVGQMVVVK